MKVKFIQEEDFTNYKKCSMFIGTTKCDFKCEKDCGIKCCQNSSLVKSPDIDIPNSVIVDKYLKNNLTNAIVFGGLDPINSFDELISLISAFRKATNDDIIIFTGFYEDEIQDKIKILAQYSNILIKFGRFIPGAKHRFDEVLGVELASDNQYAKKIS